MSYGIGRVPRDVDPTSEALAEIEAHEIVAKMVRPAAPAKPRKYMRCRECGQGGYVGEYPFSTYPAGGRCDDCV